MGPALAEEWFDAYAKGLEALKQHKGAKASQHFETAIRKRAEPGEGLITYGTNRIDAYHPYVKLAEAQLMAGDLEAAKEALARSLASGKEPASERSAVEAQLQAALDKARAAAATPPPAPAATHAPLPTAQAAAPAATPPAPLPTPLPAPRAAAAPPSLLPAPTAAPTGALALASDPPGATVLLAGRLLGVTPLHVDLPAGAYEVTLRKEGFAEQRFPVKVAAGRTTTESRGLAATAPPAPAAPAPAEVASLVIYSDPPGATVALDDEALGPTEPGSGRLVKSGVAPGNHVVRLVMPGRQDVVQSVRVGPSGPTTVRATLAPLPGPPLSLMAFAVVALTLALAAAGYWSWRRRRALAAPGGTVVLTQALPATSATTPTPADRRATAVAAPTEAGGEETHALVTPPRTAVLGERFGSYVLLEQLGKGGMAAVFKAERGGEVCALKRPLPAFLEEPEFLERFLREAEIGRTLHHPNIIRIFERGSVGRVPYFTMELVVGETLAAHVRRQGALDARAATRVIAQVAEALDYAHLKGVIHRDLKPSNIMILEDGTVKVMDYGIARARRFDGLTVTGAFLGTPDYVAPETAEGKGTDARSDLYSLGIVFYEILTGKKPFVADTPFATLRKHVSEPPTPPSVLAPGVPRELEAIVLKLLRKDPADRHPGAEELLIELRDYLNRAA